MNFRSTALVACTVVSLIITFLPGDCTGQEQSVSAPLPSPLGILQAVEQSTVSAIEKTGRSVVAISRIPTDFRSGFRNQAPQLGANLGNGAQAENIDFVPEFFGSGIVLSEDGLIVTCAHVLDDPTANRYVVWLDKRSYAAEVVGLAGKILASDPFSDLAVLKIDASGLQPAEFATDLDLRRGQFVIALGNPQAIARDGQASASLGIVANLKRVAPSRPDSEAASRDTIHEMGTLIQTDAKLGSGSSGGALVNLQGQVVGLMTSLVASSGFEASAGYAIAADPFFLRVLESLKAGKLPEYGFLGVQPENLPSDKQGRGARVSVVIPGLPGDDAGLRTRDVILEVNGLPIANRNDLFRELSSAAAGETIELTVERVSNGRRVPEILRLETTLSKKLITPIFPAYATNTRRPWRGMRTEYATAVSSETARAGLIRGGADSPKLAILDVEPGTTAWNAGLRPGFGIVAVDNQPVLSPEEFQEAVEEKQGSVSLLVTNASGRRIEAEVAVPPLAVVP